MNKTTIFQWTFAFFCLISLSSCEEVIDVDLKEGESKVVIEANITDESKNQLVKITETVPFKNESAIKNLSGAVVTVEQEGGSVYNFSEQAPGVYISTNVFKGEEEKSYFLKVSVNGKTYSAKSVMPKKVLLDSLSITEISVFDEKAKFLKLHYQDPEYKGNSYRFVIKNNGTLYRGFYVENDKFNNGRYVNSTVYTDDPEIKEGDEIEVEFQNITPEIYRYFYSIAQITGSGGPPVGASNPVSNIDNGALGYFSTHTIQKTNFQVTRFKNP